MKDFNTDNSANSGNLVGVGAATITGAVMSKFSDNSDSIVMTSGSKYLSIGSSVYEISSLTIIGGEISTISFCCTESSLTFTKKQTNPLNILFDKESTIDFNFVESSTTMQIKATGNGYTEGAISTGKIIKDNLQFTVASSTQIEISGTALIEKIALNKDSSATLILQDQTLKITTSDASLECDFPEKIANLAKALHEVLLNQEITNLSTEEAEALKLYNELDPNNKNLVMQIVKQNFSEVLLSEVMDESLFNSTIFLLQDNMDGDMEKMKLSGDEVVSDTAELS